MPLDIRQFKPDDAPRLRVICEQTAFERPFLPYVEDPRLACAFYLDPYLELEPQSCFVAVVDDDVVAYIVGSRDTARFRGSFDAWLRRKLPHLVCMHVGGFVRGRYRHLLSHRLLVTRYL